MGRPGSSDQASASSAYALASSGSNSPSASAPRFAASMRLRRLSASFRSVGAMAYVEEARSFR